MVAIDTYTLNSDPKYNFEMQNGDKLIIPKRTSVVNVVGEVLNSTTHIFDQDLSIQDYIDLSGGVTEGADLSKIFVIMPNGQSVIYKQEVVPGRIFLTVSCLGVLLLFQEIQIHLIG